MDTIQFVNDGGTQDSLQIPQAPNKFVKSEGKGHVGHQSREDTTGLKLSETAKSRIVYNILINSIYNGACSCLKTPFPPRGSVTSIDHERRTIL